VLTNEALARDVADWDADRISAKTGIERRHIAGESEFTSVLAARAAESLLRDTRFDRNAIDHLIVCTQTPDHLIPSTSCLVHEMLELPTGCAAFDINMGCSGYIYGLSTARAYINAGQARAILLINADTYTKLLRKEDAATRALFGDGATATLVTDSPNGGRIDALAFGTDGSRYRDFVALNSGLAHDGPGGRFIAMNGPSIFTFTIGQVPRSLDDFLCRHAIDKESVRYFILHQANSYIMKHLQKKMMIDESRMPVRLQNRGNIVSASIPSVLDDIWSTLHAGDRIVLVGFGVGLSWGFALVTWQ
jgi:3-oxoacyl-[acyl-carrier-protein] synthase-3